MAVAPPRLAPLEEVRMSSGWKATCWKTMLLGAAGLWLWGLGQAPGTEGDAPPARPATLDDLAAGRVTIVDLAYPLNEASAYWPGERYRPFRLETIATLEQDGVLSKAFFSPEHLGTHLDAPNHFARGGRSVDQLAPRELFAPGVVIDVSSAASMDADYQLTAADVEAWERMHGPIPAGAVVLLHTGWGRHWGNPARYQGRDVRGQLHFPGYSVAAARLLVEARQARGLGIDTMSIDHGPSRDFAVHHVVNGAGRYGLENVARLDELPPRGFYLVVAPIKIETGSGGPARVFALVP